jgi:preprotein translocase subunit SecD
MTLLGITVVVIVVWFTVTILGSARPQLGLDLQGGLSVVLFPVKGSDTSTLDTAVEIIRNRVDGLGIAEPSVSRQGDTIVVDLPGAKDRGRALDTIGKTAELRFRQVIGTLPYSSTAPSTTTTAPSGATTTVAGGTTTSTAPAATTTTGGGETGTTKQAAGPEGAGARLLAAVRPAQEAGATTTAPAGTTVTTGATGATTTTATGATTTTAAGGTTTTTVPGAGTCQDGKLVTPDDQDTTDAEQVILPDKPDEQGRHQVCYLLSNTIMTGRNIASAEAQINPNRAEWEVLVTFKNDEFAEKIGTKLVGQNVAIVLDHIVYSAPVIREQITGRDVQISGEFTAREARDLALVLRYGALPVQFDSSQQTVQDISPTLGKDQLRAGIVAGLIGLALVALYMVFFYRILGLVVWLGLGFTALTFFALTTWLSENRGLTLTLAGVTGIIVSVGVTVDSYVVYFERLKDEVRTGKTVRSSLDGGFRRAFRTIVAADLVSLLGAAVLYTLAAGSVRGFAFFLGLSTLIDLVLAYCFMHPFVVLLARRPALVRMRGVGIGAGLDVPEVRA